MVIANSAVPDCQRAFADYSQHLEREGGVSNALAFQIPVERSLCEDELMYDFELLTVQAAVDGDRDAAIRALITNPLGPSITQAPRVWDRLVELNAGLLGRLG